MAIDRTHLRRHLELLANAYGSDLAVPPGQATTVVRAGPAYRDAAARPPAPPALAPPAPTAPTPPPSAPRAAPPATTTPRPAAAASTGPQPPPSTAAKALQELRSEALACTSCKLHQGRRHVVFGEGSPSARVLFIGEAPGANEDKTGRPFVGEAGQLLDRILAGAMGLDRSAVYIANVNKCRPPGNREPEPDEVAACLPFLRRQIEILQPEVIVCLGRTAAQNLLGSTEPVGKLRGRTLDFQGLPVVVTWHPAYLLRDPSHKRETWEDIKRVNRLLGLPEVPPNSTR